MLANRRRTDDYEPRATTLAFLQPSGGRHHIGLGRAALRRRRRGGITCRKRDVLRPTREATRVSVSSHRVTLRRPSERPRSLVVSDFDYYCESSTSRIVVSPIIPFNSLSNFSSRKSNSTDFHTFFSYLSVARM